MTADHPRGPVPGSPDEALGLLRVAVSGFDAAVGQVREAHWGNATPCPGWTVRDLVNHVTVEDLWAIELFAGSTIEEVGDRFDGDQLGADALATWRAASADALGTASAPGAMTRVVHLSFGDVPGSEYAMQLFADHLVHSWDLAVAIGAPVGLHEEAVAACRAWFAEREDGYRAAGAIGPRPMIAADADPVTQLLAGFGRTR